ncbi:unnamed protein product [Brachionus calyciflorus]|uniref:DNA-dependent protein kinase catalytic subunit n=1 Tax=Brachionus calyciflorus TaxID=104777 RepID=A0A813TZ68_9BILA|nr:unnamed protein product [Brachionus calyciflorus]
MEPNDLKLMLNIMVDICERNFFSIQYISSTEIFDEKIYQLPSFIESLSGVCSQIDGDLPEGSLNTIEKLVILAIDSYPKLSKRYNHQISLAIARLFLTIRKNNIYNEFISRIIYQSLIRIFSYRTNYSIQLEEATKSDDPVETEGPKNFFNTTSLDFVQFWSNILNLYEFKEFKTDSPDEAKRLVEFIYDEYVESIIKIMNKLDLAAVKSDPSEINDHAQENSNQTQDELGVSSDPVNGLKPLKPRDFEIFINLVDFSKELLLQKDFDLFEKWVFRFSKELILLSSKHSLISGFYKLNTMIMKIAVKIGYFNRIDENTVKYSNQDTSCDSDVIMLDESEEISDTLDNYSSKTHISEKLNCFYLYKKYLSEISIRIKQFKDELLMSCLEFFLSLPKELVLINMEQSFNCLTQSLDLGVNYLKITDTALNSLEYWLKNLPLEHIKPYYHLILDKFDNYLQANNNQNDLDSQEKVILLNLTYRGKGRKRLPVKLFDKMSQSSDLYEQIQLRILKILGQLSADMSHSVHKINTEDITSWDTVQHLKFYVPFTDIKPAIYFDRFLPRVIHLALNSPNRQTKINSCELLHAIVIFTIGKSVSDPEGNSEYFKLTKLYSKMYPCLFKLSCDTDHFVRNLFQPLVMQMIHWFTGNRRYESHDTIQLLNCIMESLVEDKNAALRDFSAQCLKEFLKWSIKHTPLSIQDTSTSAPVNAKSILKRIFNFLTHPNASKRLGACLAWNSIYTLFREEEILVNRHIFEILFYLTESLAMSENDDKMYGTQEQCRLGLDHVERIIRFKSDLLNQRDEKRVKPPGWSESILEVAVRWLMRQCGRVETECRHKSMELSYKLASCITGVKDIRDYFNIRLKNESEMYFLARFEGSNEGKEILKVSLSTYKTFSELTGDKFQFNLLLTWLKLLNAPLDCYTWVFAEKLISPQSLFSSQKTCVWTSLETFIDKIALNSLDEIVSKFYSESLVFTPNEIDEYNRTKCTVIIRLMDFMEALFRSYLKESLNLIPNNFLNENFFTMIIKMTLDPTSLGFSLKDLEVFSNLAQKIRGFFRIVIQNLPATRLESLKLLCSTILSENKELNLQSKDLNNIDWTNLSQLVTGYEILNEFKIFKITFDLTRLVSNLTSEDTESQSLIEAKRKLFSLCLSINKEYIFELFSEYFYSSNCSFMAYFKAEIFNESLKRHDEILKFLLYKKLENFFPKVITFLISFLDFVSMDKNLRKSGGHKLVYFIYQNWSVFQPFWSNDIDTKILLLNLLTKCLLIESVQANENKVSEMFFSFFVDEQLKLNFKCKLLDLLHFFTQMSQFKLSMTQFITQLPLKSMSLTKGDDIYTDYVNAVQKLLVCLELSQSVDLLGGLIGIVCREKNHLCDAEVKECFEKFIKRLDSTKQMEVIKHYWNNFKNSDDDRKFVLFDKILINFLKNCDKPVFIDFMSLNIVYLMEKLDVELKENEFEMVCMNKKCVFELLDLAYKRLHKDEIFYSNAKICIAYETFKFKTVKDGKELTKEILRKSRKHMNEQTKFQSNLEPKKIEELRDLERILHCSAYNCLISLFIRTQSEPKLYYAFLFKDDLNKNEFIFEPLVDKKKVYKFQVEVENFQERKTKFISLRSEFRDAKTEAKNRQINYINTLHSTNSFNYLSSQNNYTSSLSEELSVFDFNSHGSYSQSVNSQNSLSKSSSFRRSLTDDMDIQIQDVEIELDDLNSHESMESLVSLFQSLISNKITPVYENGQIPTEMPPWMNFLHKKILDVYTHENVKLFIIRAIVNTSNIFKPFCKFWFPALIGFLVNSTLCREFDEMDYFTLDLMILILSWCSIQKPEMTESKLINKLFGLLIKRCYHSNRAVLKNNLELIKTMTECWKEMVQVPVELIYNLLTSTDQRKIVTGIQLFGVVLTNEIENYEYPSDISRSDFFKSLILCIKDQSKLIHAPGAEVVGMLFKRFDKFDRDLFDEIAANLFEILRELDSSLFITCVHRIQLNYPAISERCMTKLIFNLPQLYGEFKKMCAESILSSIKILEDPLFKTQNFMDMLTHRDTPLQLICLKMINELLDKQSDEEIYRLLPHLCKFINHPHVSCRSQLILILISIFEIYQFKVKNSNLREQILNMCKENLLKALIDEDSTIRILAQNFWTEKADMPSNTIDRMILILEKLYSPQTEREFLSYSTNLLLEKTSKSPDFNRLIYENPLSECIFKEYNLTADWRRRHEIMTPLFVETISNSFTESIDLRQNLRATQQTLQFQPTLKVSGFNWLTQSSVDTFVDSSIIENKSALLFKNSTTSKSTTNTDENEIQKLRKRFLKDKTENQNRFFARKQNEKKARDEEYKKQLKTKRENHVEKYRTYRIGDFPDIQIKFCELIAPLQALAQKDSHIAMLLFESVFVSILSELSYLKDDQEIDKIITNLTCYFNTMLNNSDSFNPNFISCILEIAIKNSKYIILEPSLITTACLNSLQQPLGIILLEEYLVNEEDSLEPSSNKKIRLDNKFRYSKESVLWIELAKLYRSMNDYDSIKGIFMVKSNLVTDYTKRGLDFEANNDYYAARKCYQEAMETEWDFEVSQTEQDLWFESLLKCCNELTDWKSMCEWSMNETNLTNLFSDSYTVENVFPYAFRSKLKLILKEDEKEQKKHADLIRFISGLETESKKYLEQSFCQELSLISLHQNDFNAAKYYAHLAIQKYLTEWSSINKTIKQNQITKLQSLQSIIELNEFLKFIDKNPSYTLEFAKKCDNLITLWTNSMPNMQTDPPCTWDDVITNRSIYFEYIDDKYLRPCLDVDQDESVSFANNSRLMNFNEDLVKHSKKLKKKMEKTNLLMKIKFAQAAQIQGNFKLALNKLQQTRSILKIKNSDLNDLQVVWIHCYLYTHVARCRKNTYLQDGLNMFFDALVLKEITKYDRVCDEFRNNVTTEHLYQDQQILHAHLSKFLIDSFLGISVENNSLSFYEDVLENEKNRNQLTEYLKDDEISCFNSTLFKLLKNGVNSLTKINQSINGCLELANYCDYYLRLSENEDENQFQEALKRNEMIKFEFPLIVIEQLLKSIRMNSDEARTRFPRLLQIVEIYQSECLDKFIECTNDIPSWMFLGWLSQITALLDKPQSKAIQKIIEKISDEYPQALIYPFKMSLESFKFDFDTTEQKLFVDKINYKLNSQLPLVGQFISALEHLNNPNLLLNDYCQEIGNNLKNRDILFKIFKDLNENLIQIEDKNEFCGRIWADSSQLIKPLFMKQFGPDFKLLPQLSELDIKQKIQKICSEVSEYYKQKIVSGNLGDYSPWLKNFKRNLAKDIEIPGQYTGKEKPMPEYHAKIESFDERILEMSSIRRPKCITIRGDDQKEYKFLVKCGEDQRQDQRIETLFELINTLLKSDSKCYQRNLSLKTYQVIPMTTKLALIEWLPETKPLKTIFDNDHVKEAQNKYIDFIYQISQNDNSKKSHGEVFGEVYAKYNRDLICHEFKKIQNSIPWDLFRKFLRTLSSNTESYFVIRNEFIKSYAVASTCQYILGIGDRHLSNWMIDLKTGRAIGIDFGIAFGHATMNIPVPELVPIRLTRQILKLIAPLEQRGLFESSMLHCLNALRENNDLLMCILDVFIKEPSIDWIGSAIKIAKKNLNEEMQLTLGLNYAKDRVNSVRDKLNGINPSVIMRNDLQSGVHKESIYLEYFIQVLLGLNVVNEDGELILDRAKLLKEKGEKYRLTVEEQVKCIIEQSTDLNILGRTWVGWQPFC